MIATAFVLILLVLMILIIMAFVQISALGREMRSLDDKFREISRQLGSLGGPSPHPPPAKPAPTQEPAPAQPPPVFTPPLATAAPLPPLATPPHRPSRTKEEWEALIGGKLLNRIGAVALIIGMGLLLKFAFDRNWITETMRVLLGCFVGGGLLFLAARTHTKGYAIFAQGLVGAGIAILYLSGYASFIFYQLVSQPVAFIVMAAVTVVAFSQAFRYDGLASAILGWFGGFLTPILLSSSQPDHVGLFSYLLLLDVGLMVIVLAKERWFILGPLTLVGTSLIYVMWFAEHYRDEHFGITVAFLALVWALFVAVDLRQSSRKPVPSPLAGLLLSLATVVVLFGLLYTLLERAAPGWEGVVSLGVSLIYLGIARYVHIREGHPHRIRQFVLTGVAFAVLSIGFQFNDLTQATLWACGAAALVTIGTRPGMTYLWIAGLTLYVISFLGLITSSGGLAYQPVEEFMPAINVRAAAFVATSIAFVVGATATARLQDARSSRAGSILHAGWIVLLFVLITVEVLDAYRVLLRGTDGSDQAWVRFRMMMTWGASWAFTSIPLVLVGRRPGMSTLLYGGIYIFFAACAIGIFRGVAYDPVAFFTPIANERLYTIVLLAGLGVWYSTLLQRMPPLATPGELRIIMRVATVLLLLTLLTAEIRDWFEHRIWSLETTQSAQEELAALEEAKQLSLSGGWLLFSIGLMFVGLLRRARSLRILAIGLFGFAILKIFIYDLSFLDTIYRIVSFLGLGVILLLASYLYQKYRSVILEPTREGPAGGAAA